MTTFQKDFGDKSHHCALCGKGFVTQGRVMRHMKAIHHEAAPGIEKEVMPDPLAA